LQKLPVTNRSDKNAAMRTIKLDQLNGTLSIDNWVTEELMKLAPHKSVFNLDTPRVVSSNLSMPKPVIATIGYFIHSKQETDPLKLAKMEALFGSK
jgi:hypothetical protein